MAWWSSAVGPPVLLALSLVSTFYFLFRAPVWCGAVNRDETLCRKNASGLLMGCSYRQHKWQKLKGTVARHGWRQLNRGLWVSPRECLTTLASIAGIISAVAAVITLMAT